MQLIDAITPFKYWQRYVSVPSSMDLLVTPVQISRHADVDFYTTSIEEHQKHVQILNMRLLAVAYTYGHLYQPGWNVPTSRSQT